MHRRKPGWAVVFAAVVVGCGGGSGSSGYHPGPAPEPQNPTNLRALSVSGKDITDTSNSQAIRLKGVTLTVNAWSGNADDPYSDRPSSTLLVESDMARIHGWGANVAPIYLDWYWFQTAAGWSWMDQVLDWCRKYDVYAIPSMVVYPDAWQRGGAAFWSSTAAQRKLQVFWKDFAERYKGRPEIAGLDVLNEPDDHDNDQLVTYQTALVDAVRSVDGSRLVFIESFYGNPFYLRKIDRTGLVYVPHYYEPFYFTGAGMPWIASDNVPRTVAYPGKMVTDIQLVTGSDHAVSTASSGGSWSTITSTFTVPADVDLAFPAVFSQQNPHGDIWFDQLEYSTDGSTWDPVLNGSYEDPAVYTAFDTVTRTFRADADHWKEYGCLASGPCPAFPDFPTELDVVERVTSTFSAGAASLHIGHCPGQCEYSTFDWIGTAPAIPATPGASIHLRAKASWSSIAGSAGLRMSFGQSTQPFWDAGTLDNSLQTLIGDFADANDVPIFLGEFTPSLLTDQTSVKNYIGDLLAWMNQRGFSWSYYEYRTDSPTALRCMGLFNGPADLTADQCDEATYVIDKLKTSGWAVP